MNKILAFGKISESIMKDGIGKALPSQSVFLTLHLCSGACLRLFHGSSRIQVNCIMQRMPVIRIIRSRLLSKFKDGSK